MTLSDAIMQRLSREVDTIFFVPGGANSWLVDALGRSGTRAVSMLHEQGAGFAAVGYAMIHGLGVALSTSGPGATNLMTPCLAAWMDSIPVIFISGQVMRKWLALPGMRSRGVQEGPTLAMVKPITKFNIQPLNYGEAINGLETAIDYARSERRGPCWIDLCQDVQGMES